MTNLHIFTYNNHQITFDFGVNQKMINATEMAKVFGKTPADFLKIKQTKRFINALKFHYDNLHSGKIVNVINGGPNRGTWMCERLALKFAAWLSPEFEIWVYEKILELLKQGYTELGGLWVYFFQSTGTQAVKIGKTYDLQKRKKRIESSIGFSIELLKAIRVPDASYERAIHKQFKHLRLKGEWFRLDADLRAYIDNLPNHLTPNENEILAENSRLLLKNKDLEQQIGILQDFRKMVLGQLQDLKDQHQFDQNSLKESQSYNQLLRDLLQMDVSHWLNEPLNQSRLMKNMRTELKSYRRQLALAWLHIIQKDSLLEVIDAAFQSEMKSVSSKSQESFTQLSLLIHKKLQKQEGWVAFSKYFELCYPGLLDRLAMRFPTMNANDLKYCSYVLMGLKGEEVGLLLGVTEKSVRQISGRLRHKFGITHNPVELGDFLKGI